MKSVTFLIGGKFSTSWDKYIPGTWGMGRRSRNVNWYKPMPRNFYELASKVWGDVYGKNRFGTVGFPNAFGQPE